MSAPRSRWRARSREAGPSAARARERSSGRSGAGSAVDAADGRGGGAALAEAFTTAGEALAVDASGRGGGEGAGVQENSVERASAGSVTERGSMGILGRGARDAAGCILSLVVRLGFADVAERDRGDKTR